MNKGLLTLTLILFCHLAISQNEIVDNHVTKRSGINDKIIDVLINYIQRMHTSEALLLSSVMGGSDFENNKACNNEDIITKNVYDSLGIIVSPSQFKHLGRTSIIKHINNTDIKLVDPKNEQYNAKKLIKFSSPRFFNQEQNCYISYKLGDFEFANFVLQKKNFQWQIFFLFALVCNWNIRFLLKL